MKEEEKKNLKNKKKSRKTAFTLIELLAVIIILGVLMVIAVPAVTKYINDSRKTGYVSSARTIISGTRTMANSEIPEMKDKNTTYYIPASYINTENGTNSPFGDFTEAYVGIIYEENGYRYFWISNDSSGHGIKTVTELGSLSDDQIESNVTDQEIIDTIESTGIENRENILILGENGEWETAKQATHTINKKGRREKLDFINAIFISGIDFNTKIKILSGSTGNVNPGIANSNIQYIKRSSVEPGSGNKQTRNLVSTQDSEVPIYAWFDNGTIYWWTEDVTPNLNESAEVMFYNLTALKEIELEDMKTENTTNMSWMFGLDDNLESLDVSNFDTSKVTTMQAMFYGNPTSKLEEITGLENFDTSNVTIMDRMFMGLVSVKNLNLSSFNTSKVTDMSSMFANCYMLESLDLSSFNTSNVTNMRSMFSAMINLKTINLSSFNTSKVTNMASMFNGCEKLQKININHFDTSNVIDMSSMFSNAQKIKTLDLSNFNTSKVTNMSYMFMHCAKLESIDISNFNTENVTTMYAMFDENTKLKTIDVSSFDTSKVTNMEYMFACDNVSHCDLTSITGLENFNTSKVTSMRFMFFHQENIRTLDLSSFTTTSLKNTHGMFAASNYTTIYASSNFDVSGVTNSVNMFNKTYGNHTASDEYVLTGGAGTAYDGVHIDKEYARIDNPANSKPGYFTLKTN